VVLVGVTGWPWLLLVMFAAQVFLFALPEQRAFRLSFAITTVVVYLVLAVAIALLLQAVRDLSS
jgi:hypothetical protein